MILVKGKRGTNHWNILYALSQLVDASIRIFSLGFYGSNIPLQCAKLQALREMKKRDKEIN